MRAVTRYACYENYSVSSSGRFVEFSEYEKLQLELNKANAKLDFLKSKGLTVRLMKTSDKPDPYLVYVIERDSELCDLRTVNKLIDAEIERDQLRKERDEANRDSVVYKRYIQTDNSIRERMVTELGSGHGHKSTIDLVDLLIAKLTACDQWHKCAESAIDALEYYPDTDVSLRAIEKFKQLNKSK